MNCPFCNDDDFDLIGLKIHLKNGWCDAYENLPDYNDSRSSVAHQSDRDDTGPRDKGAPRRVSGGIFEGSDKQANFGPKRKITKIGGAGMK